MGYFLAGIFILAILWYVISALRQRGEVAPVESPDDVATCPVRLTLLADAPLAIAPTQLVADYAALWDEDLTCTPLKGPAGALPTFQVSNGEGKAWLTCFAEPLPPADGALFAATSPGLREDERAVLYEHAATAVLHDNPARSGCPAQGRFLVKVLLALLQDRHVLGYVTVSAQRYVARASVDRVCAEHDPLSPVALYLLFVNAMHERTEAGNLWLHTHGLEQFGLPELHLFLDPGDDRNAAETTLANTAIYCLTNGPVLQPGQTAELAGNGALFDIRRFPNGAMGHDGLCGMLLLVKHGTAPIAEWV